jgi:hypothetical protein
MPDEKTTITGGEALRWSLLAVLVVLGLLSYFWMGPKVHPIEGPPPAAGSR